MVVDVMQQYTLFGWLIGYFGCFGWLVAVVCLVRGMVSSRCFGVSCVCE